MSIQEMKSKLHQLIDSADDEPTLEQLLNTANRLLTDRSMQLATLSDLTDVQHEQLEQAIQEHKQGKTVSHEEMKQRHRKWLSK